MFDQTENLIDRLLEAWDEARTTGEDVSIVDLCGDRPDLIDTVRERIALLLSVDDVASIDNPTPYEVPRQIGPFTVIRPLGHGAVSTVFLCQQETPGRLVAIKLFESSSIWRRKRFEREANILGNLDHPNIAKIYEFGRTAERFPYLVMEYVDGGSIDDYIASSKCSAAQKLGLLRRVLDAVGYAHRNGVIHRDLKPANILIDRDGNPKIIDFGIAKLINLSPDTLTSHADLQEILGTLPYMAPEQIDGHIVDYRADIYSLGVVAYEMLSGELPIDTTALSIQESIVAIYSKTPARLTTVCDCSLEAEAVAHKALEKHPADRYLSADEFSADITRLLERRPVCARKLTLARVVQSWFLRNRIAATLVCLAVFLVSSLAVAVAYHRHEASRHSEIAAQATAARKEAATQISRWELSNQRDEFNQTLQLAYSLLPYDFLLARELLEDPIRCPVAWRGWSWSFLYAMASRSNWSVWHGQIPHCVHVEEQSETVYVGFRSGRVMGFHPEREPLVFPRTSGHAVYALDVDEATGELFAGGAAGYVSHWDMAEPTTGSRWYTPSNAEKPPPIRLVVAQEGGEALLIVDAAGTVRWLDRQTQEVLAELTLECKISKCVYDPTFELLALHDGATVRVYDLRNNQWIPLDMVKHGPPRDLAFYDEGHGIVVAAADFGLLLFDSCTGQPVHEVPIAEDAWRVAAPYAGNQFAFADVRRNLFVTTFSELPNYRRVAIPREGKKRDIRRLAFSKSGDRLLAVTFKDAVHGFSWDPAAPTVVDDHVLSSKATALCVLDQHNLALAGKQRRLEQIDWQSHARRDLVPGPVTIRLAAYHAESNVLAVAEKKRLILLDRQTGMRNELETGFKIHSLCFVGRDQIAAGIGSEIALIDLHAGRELNSIELNSPATTLNVMPESSRLLATLRDGRTTLVDLNTKIVTHIAELPFRATSARLAGQQLFATDKKQTLAVVDWTQGVAERFALDLPSAPSAACFSPAGDALIVGTVSGDLCFVDTTTGALQCRLPTAFQNQVAQLAFSPDGHLFFGVDVSGDVKGWDVSLPSPAR